MAEAAGTLVLLAHPALERARIAPVLMATALATPQLELRDLYELYPDFTIDVEAEQAALLRRRRLVLQFPLFWYSSPALLKEWLDMVLTHGFAYGEHGRALEGKSLACAISTGGASWAHHEQGQNRFSIDELLRPFEQTALVCRMRWESPFVVHGPALRTAEDRDRAASRYAAFLSAPP